MKLGFIGFGGAAYGLSKGLTDAGMLAISFFDSQAAEGDVGAVIGRRAAEVGAKGLDHLAALIDGADIIISCVTGAAALEVARQAAELLQPRHLYVDVNTAAPRVMQEVFAAVEESGAGFADVAMLGAIPAFLHRVPCLASGNGAELFKSRLEPYGMDIRVVGDEPGQASAIKLFRSIFMKGILALLLEMLSATRRYRVDALVLESIATTMEKYDFLETARLQLAKGVIGAERMHHEMEAVVQTLKEMGSPSLMSEATRETLQWCSTLGLDKRFGYEMPEAIEDILEVLGPGPQP
ncbi:MAG: DUF1932 domain-containing protein [Desulfofustis sp.]|jgi:3-hydroxyisobutyrate dehydrogenase-like beta-hydroxyacid dehydrogenase|nr:DUF1932 domain-containing protein [Desulfofustis sp.]